MLDEIPRAGGFIIESLPEQTALGVVYGETSARQARLKFEREHPELEGVPLTVEPVQALR